jgi:hypothetical protein
MRILREFINIVSAGLKLAVKVTAVPAGIDAGNKAGPYRAIAKAAWSSHLGPRALAPQTLQYRQPAGIATLREQRGIGRIQTYEKHFRSRCHKPPLGEKQRIRAGFFFQHSLVQERASVIL